MNLEPLKAPRRDDPPKDTLYVCYICGREFYSYAGLRTCPPYPHLIRLPPDGQPISSVIEPIATCGSDYCIKMEQKRDDAIFAILIAPTRDAYYAQRTRDAAKQRQDARRKPKEDQE